MRTRSLFALIATLLAIATSTGVPAADPEWPKSLTLATASPGGPVLRLWRSARANSDGKTRHSGQPLADARLDPQPEAPRQQRGAACVDCDGGRPAGLERHRRLDQRQTLSGICVRCFRCSIIRFKPWHCGVPALRPSAQLDTKRVGVGPQAGATGTYLPAMLKVLGVSAELAMDHSTLWPPSFWPGASMLSCH